MVGNTGTYLDSPFHRYPERADVADLPLCAVADRDARVARVTPYLARSGARAIDAALADALGTAPELTPDAALLRGRAVLVETGWARRH
jgi:kynurenine formamidase